MTDPLPPISAENDVPVTDWEQRKLAIVHDLALALSAGEWDALRWHFAEVWDDAYDCCTSDGTPQFHNGNPYRDDEADDAVILPEVGEAAEHPSAEHGRDSDEAGS